MTRKKVEQSIEIDPALNKILVPITPLRFALANLVQQEYTVYPLGDLLLLIHEVVSKAKNNS